MKTTIQGSPKIGKIINLMLLNNSGMMFYRTNYVCLMERNFNILK